MSLIEINTESAVPLARPKIAVLLAAFNGMQWIEEQLNSIQSQIGVTVHIFISDDSSTDGTGEWIKDYAKRHSNTTLAPPNEPCNGAARNFFHLIRYIDIDKFDLIALSDQDDNWHPEKLSRGARHLRLNGGHAYSSNVTAFWPDGRKQLLDKAQPQVRWDYYFEAAGPGCTYILEKKFAIHLQKQIQKNWVKLQKVTLHDWYIYATARSHGYSWHIDPMPSMSYRQHFKNQLGANVGIKSLTSRYKKIQTGWWLGQIKLIEQITGSGCINVKRPDWKNLSRVDLLKLSVQSHQCRRRIRDQWLFKILCVITAIKGAKVNE